MPTTPRSMVFEKARVGVESTPGTPVAASRLLDAMKFVLTPAVKTQTFKASGSKYASAGSLISKQTNIKGDGTPDYREIGYYLSSALTTPVITTPSGASTARQWQWLLNSTSPDTQKTFSMESGTDAVRASHVTNVLLTDLTLSSDKQNAPKLSCAGFGNAMSDDHVRWITVSGTASGGTINIFINGNSSSGIAYNANAAAIKTAVEGITGIGAGNVRVTGGALSSNNVRIELINDRANLVITSWTVTSNLTGSGSPTATLSRLSPSATALDILPIFSTQIDEFLSATSFADLDTLMAANTIENDIANYSWGITGRNSPYFMLNTAAGSGFNGTVENDPKSSISFDVMNGPRSDYLNGMLDSQGKLYMRYRAKGPFIETASAVDLYFQLLVDTCFVVSGVSEIKGIQGNVLGQTYTGEWFKDPTTGRAAIVTLMTDVAAL